MTRKQKTETIEKAIVEIVGIDVIKRTDHKKPDELKIITVCLENGLNPVHIRKIILGVIN